MCLLPNQLCCLNGCWWPPNRAETRLFWRRDMEELTCPYHSGNATESTVVSLCQEDCVCGKACGCQWGISPSMPCPKGQVSTCQRDSYVLVTLPWTGRLVGGAMWVPPPQIFISLSSLQLDYFRILLMLGWKLCQHTWGIDLSRIPRQ